MNRLYFSMTKSLKVATVVALLALFGCKGRSSGKTATQENPAAVWSSEGINVADFDSLVEGNDSILKMVDLPSVAHVDIVTTAKEYEEDFDANEIAADQKYHSKKVLLYGTVTSINKDAIGDGYFTLASSNPIGVQAHLSEGGLERAATEKRGDRVALACDPGMRIISVATLSNCLYLSQYMSQTHVSPEEQVRGFFDGQVALPYDEAMEALAAYVIGIDPLMPRECASNPNVTTCDMSKRKLDKASKQHEKDDFVQAFNSFRKDDKRIFKYVSCSDPSHEIPQASAGSGTCIMVRVAPLQ